MSPPCVLRLLPPPLLCLFRNFATLRHISFGFPVASAMCAHVCKHKIFSFRFFSLSLLLWGLGRDILHVRMMQKYENHRCIDFKRFLCSLVCWYACVRACVCVSGTYVKALQCRTSVWHSLFEAKHSLASTHCHSVSFVRACVRAWMAGMAYTHAATAQCTLCTCNIIIIIIHNLQYYCFVIPLLFISHKRNSYASKYERWLEWHEKD